MRWSWMCAVVMACGLPVAMQGQQVPATTDPRLTATLGALRPQSRVRIITQDVHVGDFRAYDADSVRIDQRAGIRLIALRDIRTVSRSTRQVGKGAVIGAITGGVLVGALGYWLSRAFCDSSTCDPDVTAAMYGAAIGGAGGGAIGAGIGALVPGWQAVYARPR